MIAHTTEAAPEQSRQGGFTLIEVAVTLLVLSLVMAITFSMLERLSATDRRAYALVENQEKVRFVLTQLAREVRESTALNAQASAAIYEDQIELTLGSSPTTRSYIRWRFDPTSMEVIREKLNAAGGSVTASRVMLRNVKNGVRSVPFLDYYNSYQKRLIPAGPADANSLVATEADFRNCTVRLHIRITADADPGPEPFLVDSSAEIRNRLPGGIGC